MMLKLKSTGHMQQHTPRAKVGTLAKEDLLENVTQTMGELLQPLKNSEKGTIPISTLSANQNHLASQSWKFPYSPIGLAPAQPLGWAGLNCPHFQKMKPMEPWETGLNCPHRKGATGILIKALGTLD